VRQSILLFGSYVLYLSWGVWFAGVLLLSAPQRPLVSRCQKNFARPFQSTTPSIFWTRWHMSLSFWIRDYVFLPLAMMRRGMWWRNLTLVISMVLFGLWHKATVLFLLWGCYHGALLILHRQLQQFRAKLDWNPPAVVWTTLSWFVTITLISLGWILFRANSLPQALQMLSAVFSPASYLSRFLSGSLYSLVFALAAGYAAVLLASEMLDRYSAEPETARTHSDSTIVAAMARNRWYWVPPLYGLTLLLVSIVTHTQDAGAAQFMYRRF
jgi:alginate O-acetyltransferase complex protein AlgI